ncbi:MAG: VTT domain-containing protein [Planctomycetota bacterium]|jgi:uncharacterized membrane protein YdjX (TVP38/TMEM64 family)
MTSETSETSETSPERGRRTWGTRLLSVAAIVVAVFLLMQSLPLDRALEAMQGWLTGLGAWGPVVFALLYAVATVLMLPGSVLTLAAGALFGMTTGTIVASTGATTGAALAFLVGRHLARDRITRQFGAHPKFAAVDRAIGARGWKIVALLRLSPAVPFNLQNYVYGLTSIRFWPCVLTSWVAMLPGTFMYVYVGDLARAGAEAAAGTAGGPAPALAWTFRITGLAATVAVTVYLARIATGALAAQTGLGGEAAAAPALPGTGPAASARGATGLALVAVVLLAAAVAVRARRDVVRAAVEGLLGPPAVVLAEAYEARPGGPTVSHELLDAVLRAHVDADGLVDYDGLAGDAARLDRYLAVLAEAPFDALGRDEKLALLINAYNAFTLRLILDHHPVDSIRDIPAARRWDDARWRVGDATWSLNDIEHRQVRPMFREPRIHFALVCAARSCPPLRAEAYTAARLETQLADQARIVHGDPRWLQLDRAAGVLRLTPLYDWYGGDFEQVAGSVLAAAAGESAALRAALEAGPPPTIEWLDYDWSLNAR